MTGLPKSPRPWPPDGRSVLDAPSPADPRRASIHDNGGFPGLRAAFQTVLNPIRTFAHPELRIRQSESGITPKHRILGPPEVDDPGQDYEAPRTVGCTTEHKRA